MRNTLAPVATAMLNYEAGSDEQWIPGLAHATEHMMFRGSADALVGASDGLDRNYRRRVRRGHREQRHAVLTLPFRRRISTSRLRAERSRADGLLLTPELWSEERGAIIQEVKQDDSDAFYRLFTKMQNRLIGGTPYAKNTLGTVAAFNTASPARSCENTTKSGTIPTTPST